MNNALTPIDREEEFRSLTLQVMDFSGVSLSREIILERLQPLCTDAEHTFQQMLELGWIELDCEGGANAAT